MAEFDVKKIVFSSSATVYGSFNPSPYQEDMPVGVPTSPYGQTKVMCEQILRDIYVSDQIGLFRCCAISIQLELMSQA